MCNRLESPCGAPPFGGLTSSMCGTCQANASISADKCAVSDSSPCVTFGPRRTGHTEKGVSKRCFRLHIQHVCYQSSYSAVVQSHSLTSINGNGAENNTGESKDEREKQIKQVSASAFSHLYPFTARQTSLWSITLAEKLWVVLCFISNLRFSLSNIRGGKYELTALTPIHRQVSHFM